MGFNFVFWWEWSLNSGLHIYKPGTLPLEQHLQFILCWLFLEMGSHKLFAQDGLKPLSSRSQPPKELELQVWAIGAWLSFGILTKLYNLITLILECFIHLYF
jgi:hypothetical protein